MEIFEQNSYKAKVFYKNNFYIREHYSSLLVWSKMKSETSETDFVEFDVIYDDLCEELEYLYQSEILRINRKNKLERIVNDR